MDLGCRCQAVLQCNVVHIVYAPMCRPFGASRQARLGHICNASIVSTVRQFWKLGAAVREPGARTKALVR